MDDIRTAIAENITELRQNMKLTQIKLAEILNYSDKAVSKWERAEAVPDITVLKQLADYFGVSVDYLLTREHKVGDLPESQLRAGQKSKNKLVISALSVMLVWFLTTLVFTVLCLCSVKAPWTVFLIALPATATVGLVFNCIWGKKAFIFPIVTLLTWTLILTVHVLVLVHTGNNPWPLYLVGVPAQLIIILSGFIKFKKK